MTSDIAHLPDNAESMPASDKADAPAGSRWSLNNGIDLMLLACVVYLAIGTLGLFWSGEQGQDRSKAPGEATPDQGAQTGADFGMLRTVPLFDPSRSIATAAQQQHTALPATSLPIDLHGVRMSGDGLGSAIIKTSTEPERSYMVGEELQPGVKLANIGADHVVINRNGRLERLYLEGVARHEDR